GLYGTLGVTLYHEVSPDDEARAEAALARAGVIHLAARSLETLSAGEKRRVLIARALVHEPKGLVLDEPTSPLDPGARQRFLKDLERLSETTTVVLVTHHPEEIAPWFGRVLHLAEGRIGFDGDRTSGLEPSRLHDLFAMDR
ncbi:ATP-binding cassette domain-containing protein, partial [bacterium]